MDNMKHRRLQELDRSDFEVVKGEPDIRGWDVKLANGKAVGEVEDLIIDASERKVRYMVVDVDKDDELDIRSRKVLVPIGLAELHRDDDDVYIPGVKADHLRVLPEYDANELTPQVERNICNVLGRRFVENQAAQNRSRDGHPDKKTHDDIHRDKRDLEEHRKPVKLEKHSRREDDEEEVDPEFYRHEYYNVDTLYKNRMHEAQLTSSESEYDQGLRLWEKRSEGGLLGSEENSRREVNDDARMEMVRNRRSHYEQRRYTSDGRNTYHGRRSNNIIDRIRDEGLRDA